LTKYVILCTYLQLVTDLRDRFLLRFIKLI